MITSVSERYVWLTNLIMMVRYHKANCRDKDCNVSLFHAKQLAEDLHMRMSGHEWVECDKMIKETNWN